MASSEIVNTDYQLQWTQLGAVTPVPANAVITVIESLKNKANTKNVLEGSISWTIQCPIFIVQATGSGSIVASGIKSKVDNVKVMRKEDYGYCNGTYFFIVPGTCQCLVEIIDAGQIDAKGI